MSAAITRAIAASPILAMHARYEASWAEFIIVEDARMKLDRKDRDESALAHRYDDAMKVNAGETDALRLAILYQVPITPQEALVLQYHVHGASDPDLMATSDERDALSVANDTLFDYRCDEIDHDDSDGMFQSAEHIVSERRRFRTGKVGA